MTYLKFEKSKLINLEYALKREVLRTNRAGSYSNSTIINCNTRKYHGLLVSPIENFGGEKHVLLSALDESIIQHNKKFNLGIRKYNGNNYEPKGHKYIREFSSDPIPYLVYRVGGVVLSKEQLFVENQTQVLIKYTLIKAKSKTKLQLKPFLAFRNIHELSRANMQVNTNYKSIRNGISTNLYAGYPDLNLQLSKQANYIPAPDWYYGVEYLEEQKRAYDYKEDLFVPGYFELDLKQGESIIFSAGLKEATPSTLKAKFTKEVKARTPRADLSLCVENSVSQFFNWIDKKPLLVAGYPWLPVRFRDMFISLPGLCLPQKNYALFEQTLTTGLKHLQGCTFPEQLTNNKHFPIDISLWFIWCLQQYEKANANAQVWKKFGPAIKRILNGYLNTKNGILATNYLAEGKETNYNNSWMNTYAENRPVYARTGFAIETNALWYNAICFVLNLLPKDQEPTLEKKLLIAKDKVKEAFQDTFYDAKNNTWYDVVGRDYKNSQIRPNMIIAAALPYSPMETRQIRQVVDITKQQLLTPYGLRSLSPLDEQYKPKYRGTHNQREFAAINGSAWPWLYTHYFEAKHKLSPISTISHARRFLGTFEKELEIDGLCCISELYHGNPTQRGKGATSSAINTGELLRLNWILEQLD